MSVPGMNLYTVSWLATSALLAPTLGNLISCLCVDVVRRARDGGAYRCAHPPLGGRSPGKLPSGPRPSRMVP
ncbi:hypothetical protein OH77DRAFT_1427718 [Trametes cingulata]|nr:hypothetical protein OH77DRAFT_1427718 [Trametes cingulata]